LLGDTKKSVLTYKTAGTADDEVTVEVASAPTVPTVQDRRSLIVSFVTLIFSIPALIGA